MNDSPRTELSWSGWGDPAQATPLPEALLERLRAGLDVGAPTPPPASIAELELTPGRLAAATADELAQIVGAGNALSRSRDPRPPRGRQVDAGPAGAPLGRADRRP